jgi:hypothetical protein
MRLSSSLSLENEENEVINNIWRNLQETVTRPLSYEGGVEDVCQGARSKGGSTQAGLIRTLRDPKTETEVFINLKSRPNFGLNFFRDRDPDCCSGWTFLFNLAAIFFIAPKTPEI